MTIYIKIDDFIYELFPKANDIDEVKIKLSQFYTVNGVKPIIEEEDDLLIVEISDENIKKESAAYHKLVSLCEAGKLNEAKDLAIELTSKAPTISEYHRILGQVYSDLGENEEGINSLIDALRWDPENGYALIMVGNIYTRHYNDIETALKYYEQVIKIKPNDHIAINNIGANFLQQGQVDEAIDYFNKALAINSEYPNTYLGLSYAYAKKKDLTKAFDYITKGLQNYSKEDGLWKSLLGNAYKIAEEVIDSDVPNELVQIFKSKLEKEGNRTIIIQEDETIPTAAKIEYAENYNRREDVVKYNPKFPAYQHLIMHELVHLELTLEARKENSNKLFISNDGHKSLFKTKISKYVTRLENKGFPSSNVNKVVDDLFNGLNRQIFNSAPDLFIENRLYNNYPSLRPVQFVSLYNMAQNGIKAVTDKEIVKLSDPWVLSKSKILNLLNAIQFKELFGVNLIDKYKPMQAELNQTELLYEEYVEYRDDKEPSEEFEIIQHWAEDLGMDSFFKIVDENKFRGKKDNKSSNIDDVLNKIIEDPYDLDSDQSDKEEEMKIFLENQKKLGLNTAVLMFMVEAIKYFSSMETSKIKDIAFEIAMQGRQGYNPNLKYKLNKIPNKTFSGNQILAYYYVSWAIALPEMLAKLELPFEKEYELANELNK